MARLPQHQARGDTESPCPPRPKVASDLGALCRLLLLVLNCSQRGLGRPFSSLLTSDVMSSPQAVSLTFFIWTPPSGNAPGVHLGPPRGRRKMEVVGWDLGPLGLERPSPLQWQCPGQAPQRRLHQVRAVRGPGGGGHRWLRHIQCAPLAQRAHPCALSFSFF